MDWQGHVCSAVGICIASDIGIDPDFEGSEENSNVYSLPP
jgi:hypothetical protein